MKKLGCFLLALTVLLSLASCAELKEGEMIVLTPESRVTSPIMTTASAPEETTAPPSIDPPVNEEVSISFLACGDNIIHTNVYSDAKERAGAGQEYDFVPMYNGIAERVQKADIAFINHESPIGGRDMGISGYPTFNSPEEAGRALAEVGFDVVNIANNHMLDKWEKGYANSLAFWDTVDVLTVGGYTKADYDTIRRLEKDGITIAFLSYTYNFRQSNGTYLPENSSLQVPYINDADIVRQLALAKEQADLVLVSMHWGVENQFTPSAEQKRVAKLCADNGADAIIGHHPHVVQPIEWIEGQDGHRMLCVYSLGNVISTMMYGQYMTGTMISFDIVGKKDVLSIENVLAIPTVTHYTMARRGLQVYEMEDYSASLAAEHGCLADDPKFTFDRAKKYITDTIDGAFLPDFLK